MRILNWNTQADKLTPGSERFKRVQDHIAEFDADIICLTEAYAELMPGDGQTITSELSIWEPHESRGARKVVLYSRVGWSRVNKQIDSQLPEGRFVSATTKIEGLVWTIVGMCIPWHGYRTSKSKWGDDSLDKWQGACRYLAALRKGILPKQSERQRTILAGDFNLQIPARGYPGAKSDVNQQRRLTFSGWLIPTSGIRRHFIDHVAMSTDLRVESMQFVSKYASDGKPLTDHNGVCINLEIDDLR